MKDVPHGSKAQRECVDGLLAKGVDDLRVDPSKDFADPSEDGVADQGDGCGVKNESDAASGKPYYDMSFESPYKICVAGWEYL